MLGDSGLADPRSADGAATGAVRLSGGEAPPSGEPSAAEQPAAHRPVPGLDYRTPFGLVRAHLSYIRGKPSDRRAALRAHAHSGHFGTVHRGLTHGPSGVDSRVAVVLVNLGTPEEPTAREVRRYLRQFLSDRRVVNLPAILWRSILELFVLPVRSGRAAAKYRSIWLDDGSPLYVYTAAQAAGVAERLAQGDPHPPEVVFAMRYGSPGVREVLDGLRRDGIGRALVVPLYPQYSVPTVASVIDEVARHALSAVNQLEFSLVHSYPTLPGYIEALAARAEEAWERHGRPDFEAGDRMLLSFHGIPESIDRSGDPYRGQCDQTAKALRARLGLTEEQCLVTFQSKFGPMPWLRPATIDTVAELGRQGVRRLDVTCPGFASDCLETLEEINLLNRAAYMAAKPDGVFVRHECLNDHPLWLDALAGMVRSRLAALDG